MAGHDEGAERSEEATPRRKQQAAEQGQVPRSRELSTLAMLVGGGAGLLALGPGLTERLAELMRSHFALDARKLFDAYAPQQALGEALAAMLGWLAPLFGLLLVLALLPTLAVGGWNVRKFELKWQHLNPAKGLKRMFSAQALAEAGKALGKVALVGLVAVWLLRRHGPELLALGAEPLPAALAHAGDALLWSALWLAAPLALVAGFDVPFQLWQHTRQLRMTLQEVKDEMKDTDGRPEIKGRIRQLQREFAQRRMMDKVPTADVVVSNPTHYAVALKYDQDTMAAPVVVAIGADAIALKIRTIAAGHAVPRVEAPRLARALYFNASLDQPIPASLYRAVAQVLAYLYELRAEHALPRGAIAMDDVAVPEGIRTE